jgi:hypothetical protein
MCEVRRIIPIAGAPHILPSTMGRHASRRFIDPLQKRPQKRTSENQNKIMSKKQKEIIETIHCEYYFTPDEIQSLGGDLARTLTKINSLHNDLQAIKEEYKGKIGVEEARRDCLTNNIESRREMRPTRCRVLFLPKEGNKEFYNCVTNKLEKVEAMTPSDYNLELFESEPEKPLNPVIGEERQIVDAEIVLPPHNPVNDEAK